MKLAKLTKFLNLSPKDTITDEDVERGLSAILRDGLATQAMVTVTGGAFLVDFALKLGATNFMIGLLAAISPLSQLLQVPAIYIIEKYRVRKPICVCACLSERTTWLLVALLPFMYTGAYAPILLFAMLSFSGACGGVAGCSWFSWVSDLVPKDRLGSFFSKRMAYATGLGMLLSIIAGIYIDHWKSAHPEIALYGYSLLFIFGFLAGITGIYLLSRAPEPRMLVQGESVSFIEQLKMPFKDDNFRKLIMFFISWNFAVMLGLPFFTVYMLKRLELNVSTVIALTVLSQIANISSLRIWGKVADRYSQKSVLRVAGPMFMITVLLWTFTTMPEKYILTWPLLILIHILMGISTAGVNLAAGNIGLKLAPKGRATAYLATNSFIGSLSAGIAPIVGGRLSDFFLVRELSWTLEWTSPTKELAILTMSFEAWDFFFLTAFFLGLFSIYRLGSVREVGEVQERIVIQEIKSETMRDLSNFTSVGGIFGLIQFPFSKLREVAGRKKDMIVLEGTTLYARDIYSVLKETPEVGDNYQIVVDRRGLQDVLSIQIEFTESTVSDSVKEMMALGKKISRELRDLLNIRVEVSFVGSGTIPRSMGRINKILDKRKS